ncbi:MAG: CUB domain-containing protein [Bacteroidia bacterium]|nr:CUB domain-containing protein [Bacteroidia bacterium]
MRRQLVLLGAALILGSMVRAQGSCVYYMPYQRYQVFSLQSCCSGGAEFYDNGGPFNAYSLDSRDTLTFTVSSGQIEVVFSEFDVYGSDTLFIYDGSSPSAPLLAFLNSPWPTFTDFAVRSTGNSITFVLKDGPGANFFGWRARVHCVASGTPPCRQDFPVGSPLTLVNLANCCSGLRIHDDGGPAGRYLSGTTGPRRDSMVLVAPPNHRIMLSFGPSFDIMSNDTLWIIEGRPTGPIVRAYTATTTSPPIYHSVRDTVTLIFRAQPSGGFGNVPRGHGWIALARCMPKNNCEEYMPSILGGINRTNFNSSDVCCVSGFTLYDHGGPAYPHRRGVERPVFLTTNAAFTGGAGQTYEILLDSVDIHPYDTLIIGGARFTGRGSGPFSMTHTGALLSHFISDIDRPTSNSGWKATIRCASSSATNCNYALSSSSSATLNLGTVNCCGGLRFTDNGGFANNYSDNQFYDVNFIAPTNRVIKTTFAPSFWLLPGDTLYAHDGTNSGAPRLGAFSGSTPPHTLISTSNNMYFRFASDGSGNAWGWIAQVECIAACDVIRHQAPTTNVSFAPGCCGVSPIYVYDAGGPGGNYPNNQDHTITYTAPTGQAIRVEFLEVSIDGSDYLIISEPVGSVDRVIAVVSGVSRPADVAKLGPIRSSGNVIKMRFVSDASSNSAGWLAALHCIAATPGATPPCFLPMPLGSSGSTTVVDLQNYGCCGGLTFVDQGGYQSGTANIQNHNVTFSAPSGQRVGIDFAYFALSDNNDSLIVYDGPNTSSPRLGGYTGLQRPPSLTSTGGTMTVQYKSNASGRNPGWEATVRCATSTSLSREARTEVWLYPNPSTNKEAWIEALHQPIRRVRLWDVRGSLIREIQGESMRWPLQAPMGGVYIVEGELHSGDRFATRWVVLE